MQNIYTALAVFTISAAILAQPALALAHNSAMQSTSEQHQSPLGAEASNDGLSLVMVEQAGCGYCKAWLRDIAPEYPKTAEGKAAPLRVIDLHADRPDDLDLKPVIFTPTFILVREGKEISRLEGYLSEDFFWPYLERMIASAAQE